MCQIPAMSGSFNPWVLIATRAQAGGIQNQWKIDHDRKHPSHGMTQHLPPVLTHHSLIVNIELAKAARAAGTQTFVFVSSAGTRGFPSNMSPYSKMKIGVEDGIKSLDFNQAIILRPGFLMGKRDVAHTGGPLLDTLFHGMKTYLGQGVQDKLAQDDEVVARAAVNAAILAAEGKAPSKYWVLEQNDIVKLGRDEWKA